MRGLRDATMGDLDALLALERACYPPAAAYGPVEYRYALSKAKAVNLALEDRGRIVGFAGAFYHAGWRAGHVYTVNVDPASRGAGFGRRLMGELESRVAALGGARMLLEVNVANAAAIALYEGGGYARVRRLKDYYTTYAERDAFLYEKSLKPKQ